MTFEELLVLPVWAIVLAGTIPAIAIALFAEFDELSGLASRNIATLAAIASALSLVFLVFDLQKDNAAKYARYLENTFTTSGQNLKDSVTWMKDYSCGMQFIESKDSPPNFNDLAAEQRRVCDWIKTVESGIDEIEFNCTGALPNFAWREPPLHSLWGADVNRTIADLQDYVDECQTVSALRNVEEPSWLLFLRQISPFILAIAMGAQVGLTRVRMEKKNAN